MATTSLERPRTDTGSPSGSDRSQMQVKKPKVIVVGTGWSAISFLKSLRKNVGDDIDVTLVSPRNYFLYTPLLPAAATGTVEERSIVEPVRKMLGKKGQFFEAVVTEIDTSKQKLVACFPDDLGLDTACFQLDYDILVLGVGSVNNTFGIKGVKENCMFFKSIEDAHRLRRKIAENFERAALPGTLEEVRQQLLSFVIVGGGPTGVEVAAELHDMISEDLRKVYPSLMPFVSIKLIELQDHILSTYDRIISEYTHTEFDRTGIQLVLNSKVSSVDKNSLQVDTNGKVSTIPFGACVWSTGVAMHPLIRQLQEQLPEGSQKHFRSIVTDMYLRVKGSGGSIFAIGDAATIEQEKAVERVSELFERADLDKNGQLSLEELRTMMKEASVEYPHLREHSSFLEGKYGANRWGGLVRNTIQSVGILPPGRQAEASPFSDMDPETRLDKEEFEKLLAKIDQGLRALPATAQVAKQQGEYLAWLIGDGKLLPGGEPPKGTRPFLYNHKGSLAYVGSDKAVMDTPQLGPLTGRTAGILWKGFETYSQISLRNMASVSADWVRTKIWGRDLSKV